MYLFPWQTSFSHSIWIMLASNRNWSILHWKLYSFSMDSWENWMRPTKKKHSLFMIQFINFRMEFFVSYKHFYWLCSTLLQLVNAFFISPSSPEHSVHHNSGTVSELVYFTIHVHVATKRESSPYFLKPLVSPLCQHWITGIRWIDSIHLKTTKINYFQADQQSDPTNYTAVWMLVPGKERPYNPLPEAETWWGSSRIDLNWFKSDVKLQPQNHM